MRIKSKLLLAIGLILTTTLLASGIGLTAFSKFSESLGRITQESVPSMAESMELSQEGMQLSAEVALLATATTTNDAANQHSRINSRADKIEHLLREKSTASAKKEQLFNSMTKVRQLGDDLSKEVQQRIIANKNTVQAARKISQQQILIDSQLMDIIDKATVDFVLATDEIFTSNSELVSDLLKVHVGGMVRAVNIQSQTAKTVSLMIDALRMQELIALPDSGMDESSMAPGFLIYETLLTGYNDSVVTLPDPNALTEAQLKRLKTRSREVTTLVRKTRSFRKKLDTSRLFKREEVLAGFARIEELTNAEQSVFALEGSAREPENINALIAELREINEVIAKSLYSVVDTNKFLVFQSGQELRKSVDEVLPVLMSESVEELVALLQLRAELNTVAGVLAQVPQADNTSLKTLEERYLKASSTIEETLTIVEQVEGLQGVKEQITILFASGNPESGIFQSRSSELASSNSIADINTQLVSTQAAFVGDLVDQVSNSRAQVDADNVSVTQLIGASRSLLIGVSIASVIFTVLLFWLYISKDILGRLLRTIAALRSLAEGDYSVQVDNRGNDELTDLANTVEVFKHNALEAQRLQEEQAQAETEKRVREQERAEQARSAREEELRRHEQEQQAALEQQTAADALQQRVDKLLDAVSAAAEGNLSYPIDCSGNDLAGQMGKALDSLFSELRQSMSGINDNAIQLATASESLTNLSVDMKKMATDNTTNARKASTLTNDVGTSVDKVARATEQMNSSIKDIAHNTTEAESVASEAVELAKTTDLTVRKLAESSAGIGNVIKVITSIAEQTNLLALNATIEAARAGEAGKGFAVVANEVKELAKETAKATEQIESRITDIQTDTDSAVQAIESIGSIIDKISDIQSHIAAAIEQQSDVTQGISGTILQTAEGSEAITRIISGVAEKAKTNQQASDDVNTAATDLSNMASELQNLVARFTVDQQSTTYRKAA